MRRPVGRSRAGDAQRRSTYARKATRSARTPLTIVPVVAAKENWWSTCVYSSSAPSSSTRDKPPEKALNDVNVKLYPYAA